MKRFLSLLFTRRASTPWKATRPRFRPVLEGLESRTLLDSTPPTIICPAPIVVEATGGLTPVTFSAAASDDSGTVTVVPTRPPRAGFPLGGTSATRVPRDP